MPAFINLTSRRFGRLTVVSRAATDDPKRVLWLCLCDCGQQITTRGESLRYGNTKSCGCYKRDVSGERAKTLTLTHGHARRGKVTKTFLAWVNMWSRCTNQNSKDWPDYGGRGITCDQWPKFEDFLAYMGEAPPGKSLDRWPDPNGNYERGNMRWATPKEQNLNQRPRKLTPEQARAIRTDPRPRAVIAAEYGINYSMVGMIKRRERFGHA